MNINDVNTLEHLFRLWQEKHCSAEKNRFIVDGIVNPDVWCTTSPKVCFLLKEGYFDADTYENDLLHPEQASGHHWNPYISACNGQYIYDFAKHLREHTPWSMWSRVESWMYRLFPLLGIETETPLQHIAVVNIKKSAGESSSKYRDILNYAKEDRDFIRRELELINPDFIVCGATYDFCVDANLLDDLQEITVLDDFGGRRVSRAGKRIIFDYFHPSAPTVSYDGTEAFFEAACAHANF